MLLVLSSGQATTRCSILLTTTTTTGLNERRGISSYQWLLLVACRVGTFVLCCEGRLITCRLCGNWEATRLEEFVDLLQSLPLLGLAPHDVLKDFWLAHGGEVFLAWGNHEPWGLGRPGDGFVATGGGLHGLCHLVGLHALGWADEVIALLGGRRRLEHSRVWVVHGLFVCLVEDARLWTAADRGRLLFSWRLLLGLLRGGYLESNDVASSDCGDKDFGTGGLVSGFAGHLGDKDRGLVEGDQLRV